MIERLYNKLNGFRPGGVYCIASRPAVGKTIMMLNLALDCAQKFNKKVLIFSIEMSKGDIGDKIHRISGEEQNIKTSPIYIDDDSFVTPNKIKEEIDSTTPDVVFIDYLQLMSMDTKHSTLVDILYAIKTLAKEANIPVVILSQLSRGRDERPLLVDLRIGRTSDQNLDVVIFLYDPEHEMRKGKDKKDIEIIVAKNRWGGTFTLNSRLDCSTLRYTVSEDE